jgi:hypothetical protein
MERVDGVSNVFTMRVKVLKRGSKANIMYGLTQKIKDYEVKNLLD